MPSILNATTTTGLVTSADNSGELRLQTNNGTTAVTIDTSQNVGIGTASPTTRLTVDSANTGVDSWGNLAVRSTDSAAIDKGAHLVLGGSFTGTSLTAFGSIAGRKENSTSGNPQGYLQFSTAASSGVNTESMRIDSAGSLLLGTTVIPTGATGGSCFEALSNNRRALKLASTTTGSATLLNFLNPNGSVGSIVTDGSSTSYNTSSDYRLKENIAPMTGALSVVQQLKPVIYNWKSDGSNGQGFIAHELQQVVPDCVTGEKDAVDEEGNPQYQGIDTSFLVATLTAAIQELNAKVDAQALEIQALKGVA